MLPLFPGLPGAACAPHRMPDIRAENVICFPGLDRLGPAPANDRYDAQVIWLRPAGEPLPVAAPPPVPTVWQRLHGLVDLLEQRARDRRRSAQDRALARLQRRADAARFAPAGPVAAPVRQF